MTGGPPVSPKERELRKRAAAWPAERGMADAVSSEGLDFATAVLHEFFLSRSANARFARKVFDGGSPDRLQCDLIGVVPGAFHQNHRGTGADGARIFRIARQLGCPAELVPVSSFGTLEQNAEVLFHWLDRHPGRKIALISLSKGSADVRCALQSPHVARLRGMTWISFSGMSQGTPLVDWLRRRPLRWLGVRFLLWWGGHDIAALDQLGEYADYTLPEGMRAVHVHGFPLRCHLRHRWAGRGYRRLAPLGPNDGGGILLESLSRLPGVLFPIWGADHYLNPAWDAEPLFQQIVARALSEPASSAAEYCVPTE